MAHLLSFFTRRLIVKELISGYTGNKKLNPELFVSCTSAFAPLRWTSPPLFSSSANTSGLDSRSAKGKSWWR